MPSDRRGFLTGVTATFALTAVPGRAEASAPPSFLSCAADPHGQFLVAGLGSSGGMRFLHPLPGRGHGIAVQAQRRHAVIFARRPGSFALIVDLADGRMVRSIAAPDDRHFYGHGTYSADGRWLFATENDFHSGRGVVGIYDAETGYRRTAEIASGGIGPHEVRLMPDGATLVVANGGIRTHPDQGRAKLNLSTMTSSLAFVELASGKVLARARLATALGKLSIRHLDVARDGRVAIAMQYEGDRRHRVPLIGLCEGAGPIRPLSAPTAVERKMKHYSGSVAFDRSARWLALTCPRGHLVTLWDARDGRFHKAVEAFDASGVAATGTDGAFLISGGDGSLRRIDAETGVVRAEAGGDNQPRWDNHICLA